MRPDFELRLPATSANLGPGFDSAALALALHLRIRARRAEAFALTARGRDAAVCGKLDRHLILEVYHGIARAEGQEAPALAVEIENGIPIGKGCGSSAAARLAGVGLADHFLGLGWSAQRIFEEAAKLEGHPDNAAACWWGGLVVAQSRPRKVNWLQIAMPTAWPLLLALPSGSLATESARAVLPTSYSRGDAVANVQAAMMLAAALQQGRGDQLADALEDRLHQPYRAGLCPLLPALASLAGRSGILGVALSGAGPSVLMFVRGEGARAEALAAVQAALGRAGLEAELLEARVETEGPGLARLRAEAG